MAKPKVTDITDRRERQRWDTEVWPKEQWLTEVEVEYDDWINAGQLQVAAAILRARRAGASWADIGTALYVTRQEAHRRWKDLVKQIEDDPALEKLLDAERVERG